MACRHRFPFSLIIALSVAAFFIPATQQSNSDVRSTVISLLEIGDARGALVYLEEQHTSQVIVFHITQNVYTKLMVIID